MSEAELQAHVVDLARMLGWHHLHVRRSIGKGNKWATTTSIIGWPDLLLWRPGRVVAVELKSATGKLTAEQTAVLESLAAAGIETHVWRPADLQTIADTLSKRQAA